MSMISEALTVGTWHELTDLDDPNYVQFYVEAGATDVVMIAFSDSEPTDQTAADVCNTGGLNYFQNLFQRRVWLKLFNGSANVIYSQRGAIEIDEANCATVTTDYAAINRVDTAIVIPGYDTTPADDLLSVGLIHTIPAGLDEAATIDSAILILNFAGGRDRTFQIAGMKALTSITSGLTGFENLAGPLVTNVTSSNVTFTVGIVPSVKLDVTDIVQELVNQSGWNADSPIQLRILDSVMAPEDSQDHRINVLIGGRLASLFVRSS